MSMRPSTAASAILAELNAGRFKPAYLAAKKAMAEAPRDATPVSLAALALTEMGRGREALPLFQKAIKLEPGHPGHQTNLIQALLKLGQPAKAGQLAGQLLERRPDDAGLAYLAAIAAMQQGDHDAALALVSRAIAADPANPRALDFRGALQCEVGHDRAAIADFDAALALAPGAPETLANIAKPLARQGRTGDALAALDAALVRAPGHPGALENRAAILAECGRLDEARAAYEALLSQVPDHAEALGALSLLVPVSDLDKLSTRLRTELARAPARSERRAVLGFALARAAQRAGDADTARRTLSEANALMARLAPHDSAAARAGFAFAEAEFPVSAPLPAIAGAGGPRPIFIIGQPRSGTTLIEQVLSSHPDVAACGELPTAHRLVSALRDAATGFDPAAFARAYLDELPETARQAPAFTDKMPGNYRYLGHLAAALPQARFIHVTRDARDVALSMWRLYFPAPDMRYSFSLAAMAQEANLYRRYMNHWRSLLGARLLEIAYEDATADIETASRRLADHAGLSWTPAMAAPETNTAPVRTASITQVRAKVHRASVGGWREEAKTLAPFIAALDPALWPELGLDQA